MSRNRLAVFALVVCLSLAMPAGAQDGPLGDCASTPPDAITTLPEPLSKWGTIVCTEFGHIISNREGWIWSQPTAYAPVFIPSQMVRMNPAPVGNQSYFTKIELTEITADDAEEAIAALPGPLEDDSVRFYRLEVTGSMGRSLTLVLFDLSGPHDFGVWCTQGCSPESAFMILDMTAN